MNPFAYERVADVDAAISAIGPDARFLAGGTNLLDLMKGDIENPSRLIDINRLPLAQVTETAQGGLRIGALVRNSDCAENPVVKERYPLLSQALLAGASPQLRNMASVGGNLMQRTRCYYFYDTAFAECNKRDPGSGCAAREGFNRIHAILGASDQCVAVHPSDMAVALAALDAQIEVQGPDGTRRIAASEFHRLPGDAPQRDTVLGAGELIVAIELPPNRLAGRSLYLKLRDRASFAFALVSVAAALEVENGVVKDARVALGGVAHKPWRPRDAERALIGSRMHSSALARAADAAIAGARPLQHNAFKVELARRAVVRALETLSRASG